MAPLQPVKSSQIAAIGHDPSTNVLAVQFHGKGGKPGSVYHYQNVPPEKHQALVNAPSIGSHFGQHIKARSDLHPFQKVA